MIKSNQFFEVEKQAPLLNLNHGFLEKEGDALFERVSNWPSLIEGLPEKASIDESNLPEPDRIHIHDAERTFTSPANRQKLIRILNLLNHKFEDYAQGLSYVASFLLLTIEEETVINILVHLNSDPKYLPGYWRTQSIASATDAHVFNKLMSKHFPEVHQHLVRSTIQPDTYCQKWFVGLCVHVLPFEALFPFFENFFKYGQRFLLSFALSLIKHIQEQLLATTDPSKIYALLRLDEKFVPRDVTTAIVQGHVDFDLSDVDIEAEREEAFNTHLKARLEAAKRRQEEQEDEDEITDYSTTDDESDVDEVSEAVARNLKV